MTSWLSSHDRFKPSEQEIGAAVALLGDCLDMFVPPACLGVWEVVGLSKNGIPQTWQSCWEKYWSTMGFRLRYFQIHVLSSGNVSGTNGSPEAISGRRSKCIEGKTSCCFLPTQPHLWECKASLNSFHTFAVLPFSVLAILLCPIICVWMRHSQDGCRSSSGFHGSRHYIDSCPMLPQNGYFNGEMKSCWPWGFGGFWDGWTELVTSAVQAIHHLERPVPALLREAPMLCRSAAELVLSLLRCQGQSCRAVGSSL